MVQPPTIDATREHILTCRRCELSLSCTPQPGQLTPLARLVFVGLHPSTASVHTGSPWMGRTGRAMARELERVNINPETVSYINVLCCQPNLTPENPKPPEIRSAPTNWPFEVRACRVHLKSQLQQLSASVVVTIGEDVLHAFLPRAKLSHARNEFIPAHGRHIFPIDDVGDMKRSTFTALQNSLRTLRRALDRKGPYPMPRGCLYCGKRTEGPDAPTCHKTAHKKLWAKDQIWESPRLTIYQEELPLG